MNRVILTLLGALGVLLSITGTAPTPASRVQGEGSPPGRLVEVGGRRMHLLCRGSGTPVVVIVPGAGGGSAAYGELLERIAGQTRACTYDRPGLGWSEPAAGPRSLEAMATELRELLHNAALEPPFILLGHSLGGYVTRIFVDRYGDQVAGVVLAESAHEQQWERLPEEAVQATEAAIELGLQSTDPMGRAIAAELRAGIEDTPFVGVTGGFGDRPLAVVSARDSFAAFAGQGIPRGAANAAWMEMQEELTGLSTRSVHLVSESGDHRIHRTDPELVAAAVREVLEAVRAGATRESSAHTGPLSPLPSPAAWLVLPERSDPDLDELLAEVEAAYASMEVDRFMAFFTDDFTQLDVGRRVRVEGKEAWRQQTRRVNGAHRRMARRHHGRARIGDWAVVEIEWSGTVAGEALGEPGEDRAYRYSGLGLMRLVDGRVAEQILYPDVRTLVEQLGESVLQRERED